MAHFLCLFCSGAAMLSYWLIYRVYPSIVTMSYIHTMQHRNNHNSRKGLAEEIKDGSGKNVYGFFANLAAVKSRPFFTYILNNREIETLFLILILKRKKKHSSI